MPMTKEEMISKMKENGKDIDEHLPINEVRKMYYKFLKDIPIPPPVIPPYLPPEPPINLTESSNSVAPEPSKKLDSSDKKNFMNALYATNVIMKCQKDIQTIKIQIITVIIFDLLLATFVGYIFFKKKTI